MWGNLQGRPGAWGVWAECRLKSRRVSESGTLGAGLQINQPWLPRRGLDSGLPVPKTQVQRASEAWRFSKGKVVLAAILLSYETSHASHLLTTRRTATLAQFGWLWNTAHQRLALAKPPNLEVWPQLLDDTTSILDSRVTLERQQEKDLVCTTGQPVSTPRTMLNTTMCF